MRATRPSKSSNSETWWIRTGSSLVTYLILAAVGAANLTLIFWMKPAVGSFPWLISMLVGAVSALVHCMALFIILVIFGIPQRLFRCVEPDDDEPHEPDGGP